jgi:OOP family OmpA-OmpF porin
MRKHLMAFGVIAGSMVALGNVAAAEKPGYMYDTYGKPAKDTYGECVKSVYRQKDAYPECEPGAAPAKAKERVSLDAKVLFDFDKSSLRPDGKKELDGLASRLQGKYSQIDRVDVVGHTDSIGTDGYNQKLSERRAATVKSYLGEKGIPAAKLTAKGMGESQPVADNKTRDGRQLNRRVEVDVEGTLAK